MDNPNTVNPQITQSLSYNYNIVPAVLAELNKYNLDPLMFSTLRNTVYPGVKDEVLLMILSYCAQEKIDPLQKLVHAVPMYIPSKKCMQDVIMPGIGLYRVIATRTGAYAGIDEPEYGPDITEELGTKKITYPQWCKIKVKKIVQGRICEFVALEYWKENYATASKDSQAPNTMWAKRPYGQLAKCTEAQGLRKAFQDKIPQIPTMEEMEGKSYEHDPINEVEYKSTKTIDFVEPEIVNTSELIQKLNTLIKEQDISAVTIEKWCTQNEVTALDKLPLERLIKCINHLESQKNKSEISENTNE